ncbi:hypothetical protein ASPWEDRAFT_166040 [Aspergillus wentii DTO 134E9]|uniref:Uncharacterized protein n=1 Tax=Aspergillus wentii DTO 134E9 TaxID=1073089 RepID=A0A1L9R3T8_ASPWE|nr:uncharacterized protein ASPWEDRAFT_166040 [Aspergillus wentii DTO 134E9]OJJ29574.1 hypothetical protein ASPWEDRAFT_166040 [Aspergillus wentii DTO 134E9]
MDVSYCTNLPSFDYITGVLLPRSGGKIHIFTPVTLIYPLSPLFYSIGITMGTQPKTAGYHRNAARRRKTIFKKCEELSRLGVDLWIIIGSTDQTHVFKSRDRGLFDKFDRQVMLSCARPKW